MFYNIWNYFKNPAINGSINYGDAIGCRPDVAYLSYLWAQLKTPRGSVGVYSRDYMMSPKPRRPQISLKLRLLVNTGMQTILHACVYRHRRHRENQEATILTEYLCEATKTALQSTGQFESL